MPHLVISLSNYIHYLTIILSKVIIAEVMPKDKKSKEEKTLILGQCCIDMLPLLKGSVFPLMKYSQHSLKLGCVTYLGCLS